MKIGWYILFVGTLLLLLTSCQTQAPPVDVSVGEPPPVSLLESPADTRLETIEDWDAYLRFVETATLPEGFIHYTQLASIGEWDLFINSSIPQENMDSFLYRLIDERGEAVSVAVTLTPPTLSAVPILMDAAVTDYRFHPNKSEGVLTANGVTYRYASYGLQSIRFTIGTAHLEISNDRAALCQYPTAGANTVVSHLLDPGRNESALLSLKQDIVNNAVKQ